MTHKKIEEYKQCLREERFYDAHEVLEAIWFPRRFEDDNEVKLLKGFINAAVSFELFKKGRIAQSKKVWRNYLKYRQLVFQTQTVNKNLYYQLIRFVEMHAKKLH